MVQPEPQVLAEYFTQAAQQFGMQRSTGEQAGYSLLWYFEHYLNRDLAYEPPQGQPNLLKLYLGGLNSSTWQTFQQQIDRSVLARDALRSDLDRHHREWFSGPPLNSSQRNAVASALTLPISFVQGPPGTGKTATIARMAALAVSRGEKVAIVSTNATAVSNVEHALARAESSGGAKEGDLLAQAAEQYCLLGNAGVRSSLGRGFRSVAKDTVPYESGGEGPLGSGEFKQGWEESMRFAEFTDKSPIILSTVHSLKKCFRDGAAPQSQYDLLIMDESSQTNLMVGLVALSSARRVVLVGDDEQLPPIYNSEALQSIHAEMGSREGSLRGSAWDMSASDPSFLSSCYDVFAPQSNSPLRIMLDKHYRCHPGIIGFSNTEIYGNKLDLSPVANKVRSSGIACPIRVLWYEGDYRERCYSSPDGGRTSVRNAKQLTVLRYELAGLVRQQIAAGQSICVLSPFRAQAQLVKELFESLVDADSSDVAIDDDSDADAGESTTEVTYAVSIRPVPQTSTVHKSQGQEFDVVYLLPVEDGHWEPPWSQGRRLVNVAVTRAKEELYVVLSTKMMAANRQQELAGRVSLAKNAGDPYVSEEYQELYIQKLVDYVAAASSREGLSDDERERFGLHRSAIRSIFDDAVYTDRAPAASEHRLDSVLEEHLSAVMRGVLQDERFRRLRILTHVPLAALRIDGVVLTDIAAIRNNDDVASFLSNNAHLDFVLVDASTGQVRLVIEVDGWWHRFNVHPDLLADQQRRDVLKDQVMGDCGADIWSSNHADQNPSDPGTAPFGFLRLATDGSAFWETDQLRTAARGTGEQGADVRTIEDLLEQYMTQGAASTVTVDSSVLPPENLMYHESVSLSAFLREWKESHADQYHRIVGENRAQDISPLLAEAGYLYNSPDGWQPTAEGRAAGITTAEGRTSGVYPQFTASAQHLLKQVLPQLLGPQGSVSPPRT